MTGIEETNSSQKAFLLDLHEIIFSFVKIALHTKITSDSGIKTMPLSS